VHRRVERTVGAGDLTARGDEKFENFAMSLTEGEGEARRPVGVASSQVGAEVKEPRHSGRVVVEGRPV